MIYTDGNHQAGTLGQIGQTFSGQRLHGTTSASTAMAACRTCSTSTTSSPAAARFLSGADTSVAAYERQDKRENTRHERTPDGTTLLFMMNADSSNGEGGRAITTTFAAGSYLYQYATAPATTATR